MEITIYGEVIDVWLKQRAELVGMTFGGVGECTKFQFGRIKLQDID